MFTMPDLKQRDASGEPLVTLDDVCDANEILLVRYENERRAQKAAERKSKSKGRK